VPYPYSKKFHASNMYWAKKLEMVVTASFLSHCGLNPLMPAGLERLTIYFTVFSVKGEYIRL